MKCKGEWRVGHCIVRGLQRITKDSNATQDVRKGKKVKIQCADNNDNDIALPPSQLRCQGLLTHGSALATRSQERESPQRYQESTRLLLDNSLKQMHLAALVRDEFVNWEIKELHGRVNHCLWDQEI